MGGQRQGGFSLLEVMAALGVFAIVTLGVVPLLGSAIKASSASRSETVAQEAARNIMERIQGTKWYVSYDAKPNKRVDILDLYYPQTASNAAWGQTFQANIVNAPLSGTGGVFTTTCPNASNPACNFDLPSGYTATIKASFIKKVTPATNPETYSIVTPCVTAPCTSPYTAPYAWNVQSNDVPASPLMDIEVAVAWTQHAKPKSFSLRGILGERKFSAPAAVDAGPSPTASAAPVSTGVAKIHGNAAIDYVAQVTTGYSAPTAQPATGCPALPCLSEATMTFGMGESTIHTEDVGSTADQTDKVAEFRLVRAYPSTQAPPPTPPPDLDYMAMSASVKHAPPYSLTNTDQLNPNFDYLDHTDLGGADQAMVFGGQNTGLLVDTRNELPQAEGTFRTYSSTNGVQEAFFTNTQIDYNNYKLDSTQPLGFFTKYTTSTPSGYGSYTKANSYALTSASRAVETKAFSGFNNLAMLRFKSGTGGSARSWNAFNLSGATANVNCKATGNRATASATATYNITWALNYDNLNNGTIPSSPTPVFGTVDSAGNDTWNTGSPVPESDSIARLKTLNPLIYDDPNNLAGNLLDIYLFEKRDPATGQLLQKGYISDIVALRNPPTSISADGRTVSASIDGALRVDFAALNASIPQTATTLSLFKTGCEAVDNR